MLELLDLRDRRERLEPRRLEIDPHVSAVVSEIVRPFDYEKGDLFELTLRFTKSAAAQAARKVLSVVEMDDGAAGRSPRGSR